MRQGMTRRRAHAAICGAICLLAAALYAWQLSGTDLRALAAWEHRLRDWVAATGRHAQNGGDLVYLGIDTASISISPLDLQTLYRDVPEASPESRALNLIASGWPWSREVYALLAERLLEAGAGKVVLDLLLLSPGNGDEALAAVLRNHPGRIVLGSNFAIEDLGAGQSAWTIALPTASILPDVHLGHPAVGYVNFWPDADGVVRRVQYRASLEQMTGAPPVADPQADVPAALSLRAAGDAAPAIAAPMQPRLMRWSGPPGTFPAAPLYQVFVPRYWQQNFGSGGLFRGKTVVIGPAGNWAHDEHLTPFGQMPGPEVHLNALNALLRQAFLSEAPPWAGYGLIAAAAFAAWALAGLLKNIWLRAGAFVVAAAAWIVGLKIAYDFGNTVLPGVLPLLTLGIGGLGTFVYDYTHETLEKLRVRRTLEAYVSEDVVREVLDNPATYLNSLGGTRAKVALLMTDLRGFTTMTERMDSGDLVTLLNEYLAEMVSDIFTERGSVDKFIGDAILAVWGHLNSRGAEQDAASAVAAFLRMRASLARLNSQWEKDGKPTLEMGCGVNFGEVIFGNIGSARKKEVTVIGDAVNVTARLEGLTKQYGRELLLGNAAADLVGTVHRLQLVDLVAVKGKLQPLKIYSLVELIGEVQGEAAREAYLRAWSDGLDAYVAGYFADAQRLFEQALDHLPGDPLARLFVQRSEAFIAHPPDGKWEGVYVAQEK